MAPTVSAPCSKETSAHRMRKPMVEKLRRDRINTCIEQLKSLLGPEFLRQQPSSKQEKADVLEMTVAFLQTWQQSAAKAPVSRRSSGDGYSRCVQEAVSFLSHSVQTQAHRRLLGHFQGAGPDSPPASPPQSPHSPQSPRSPRSPCSPRSPLNKNHCKTQSSGLWRPW